jgi:putative ABC transport system substrate-binding protein
VKAIRALPIAAAFVLFLAPLTAEAQAGKMYRLGLLNPAAPPLRGTVVIEALRELGYIEGQNLKVERRYAEGRLERLPALADELVRLRVDVIVATSNDAIQAARKATTTIPIVMGFGADPVERGFVASFARPGGNITGVTIFAGTQLAGKRLELLKEAVPQAMRIAVLTSDLLVARAQVKEAEKAGTRLGVKLVVVDATDREYARAFATMKAERAGALFVVSSTVFNRDRMRIIELAAKHRLPAIYEWREHVEEGGLMAYGSSNRGLFRRVAAFVDRIFKGANPAELPVEQPTVFELTVNMRVARALGLTFPPSILVRADHVIE